MSSANGYARVCSLFGDAIAKAKSFTELRSTAAYSDFIKVASTKTPTSQQLKLGTRRCMIFPRNSPAFWAFLEMRMKMRKDDQSPVSFQPSPEEELPVCQIGETVLDTWDQFMYNETFPSGFAGLPSGLSDKRAASYEMHVTPYHYLKNAPYWESEDGEWGKAPSESNWKNLQLWALDIGERPPRDASEAVVPKTPPSSPKSAPSKKKKRERNIQDDHTTFDRIPGNFRVQMPDKLSGHHWHVCDWCGMPYGHYHNWNNVAHKQFPKQCPYEGCKSYGIDKTRPYKVQGFMEFSPLQGMAYITTSAIDPLPLTEDESQMDVAGGVSLPGETTTTTTSGTTGAAGQPFAEDMSSALTQTAVNMPAIVGGTGAAASNVFESLGGFTPELATRGAFMNSILAPCYEYCPLTTLDVGTETVENTVLATYDVNPWDQKFSGPYIKQWADLHQRFVGSFQMSLNVASAGTILGKIGIYYIPGDCVLPKNPTRQSLVVFQHVIVDLQQPSAQAILVRNSNQQDFYLDRDNVANKGQIIMIAFTNIQNTYGATVGPPVYPEIMLGPDAMFFLPKSSVAASPGTTDAKEYTIPPTPTGGSFTFFTDGKNLPQAGANFISGLELKPMGSYYQADHVLCSGVTRMNGSLPQNKAENDLAFMWGAWRDTTSANWTESVKNKFPGSPDLIEGTVRNTSGGAADDSTTPDTLNTMAPPYNFDRVVPSPNSYMYQGFQHTNTLFPETSTPESEAQYIITNIAPVNKDVPFGKYKDTEAAGEQYYEIFPVYNTSTGILYHTRLDNQINPMADRCKLVLSNVTMSCENAKGSGPFTHNVDYKNFTASRGAVCRKGFPADGSIVPPSYKLLYWFDKEDTNVFPFGLSGVVNGVKGTTHLPTKSWLDFWTSATTWLKDNNLASYELKGATANGQTVVFLLVNNYGVWVYNEPDYSACVSDNRVFNWTLKNTYETNIWPILTQCSPAAFQSRIVGMPAGDPDLDGDVAQSCHPGFKIRFVELPEIEPAEEAQEEEEEEEEQDEAQSMAGAAIFGGLLSGMGNALGSFQEQQYMRQNQLIQNAQQTSMQKRALANARAMVEMQGKNAMGVSVQQGKNAVAAVNARLAGTNPMRNVSANATTPTPARTAPTPPVNIPDGQTTTNSS